MDPECWQHSTTWQRWRTRGPWSKPLQRCSGSQKPLPASPTCHLQVSKAIAGLTGELPASPLQLSLLEYQTSLPDLMAGFCEKKHGPLSSGKMEYNLCNYKNSTHTRRLYQEKPTISVIYEWRRKSRNWFVLMGFLLCNQTNNAALEYTKKRTELYIYTSSHYPLRPGGGVKMYCILRFWTVWALQIGQELCTRIPEAIKIRFNTLKLYCTILYNFEVQNVRIGNHQARIANKTSKVYCTMPTLLRGVLH